MDTVNEKRAHPTIRCCMHRNLPCTPLHITRAGVRPQLATRNPRKQNDDVDRPCSPRHAVDLKRQRSSSLRLSPTQDRRHTHRPHPKTDCQALSPSTIQHQPRCCTCEHLAQSFAHADPRRLHQHQAELDWLACRITPQIPGGSQTPAQTCQMRGQVHTHTPTPAPTHTYTAHRSPRMQTCMCACVHAQTQTWTHMRTLTCQMQVISLLAGLSQQGTAHLQQKGWLH